MSALCWALSPDIINLLIQSKSLTMPWALPGTPLPARGPPSGTLSTAQEPASARGRSPQSATHVPRTSRKS